LYEVYYALLALEIENNSPQNNQRILEVIQKKTNIPEFIIIFFSYENQNPGKPEKPKKLNTYNRIRLDRFYISRLSSKDKFEDYNLIDSCDPGK
jgi:hypothetical protein